MLIITVKPVFVEAANSMGIVERYYTPIRRPYRIIRKESQNNLDHQICLQYAVKAVNDSVGPDGLVPTLLVYSALPMLGLESDTPSPSMEKRSSAIRKATNLLSKASRSNKCEMRSEPETGPTCMTFILLLWFHIFWYIAYVLQNRRVLLHYSTELKKDVRCILLMVKSSSERLF
eukprot:IDg9423t1